MRHIAAFSGQLPSGKIIRHITLIISLRHHLPLNNQTAPDLNCKWGVRGLLHNSVVDQVVCRKEGDNFPNRLLRLYTYSLLISEYVGAFRICDSGTPVQK